MNVLVHLNVPVNERHCGSSGTFTFTCTSTFTGNTIARWRLVGKEGSASKVTENLRGRTVETVTHSQPYLGHGLLGSCLCVVAELLDKSVHPLPELCFFGEGLLEWLENRISPPGVLQSVLYP